MPTRLKNYKDKGKARDKRNRDREKNYAKSEVFALNKNSRYTNEECEKILEHSITDFELAKEIERSVRAIQMKRYLLRREENENGSSIS